jgi:hypothetical protein
VTALVAVVVWRPVIAVLVQRVLPLIATRDFRPHRVAELRVPAAAHRAARAVERAAVQFHPAAVVHAANGNPLVGGLWRLHAVISNAFRAVAIATTQHSLALTALLLPAAPAPLVAPADPPVQDVPAAAAAVQLPAPVPLDLSGLQVRRDG